MNHNTVVLENYNSLWPHFFLLESNKIRDSLFSSKSNEVLSYSNFEMHHIGSTAIAGMPAKPVIDMMLEFDSLDAVDFIKSKLKELRYSDFTRHVIPHYSYFSRKQEGDISFHLHIRERGDPQIKRHIHFRDYLISHEHEAKEYAKIKTDLAKQFYNNRYAYTLGKDEFIQSIDRKAKLWSGRRKKFLLQNTNLTVANSSQEKIQQAIEANIIVHMTHFEQFLPMLEFKRQSKYTSVLNSNIPENSFNYILEAEILEEEADNIIQEATKKFEEKNLPYTWWAFPNNKPNNLDFYLEKNAFQNTQNNFGMYFDLDAFDGVIPELIDFKILKVNDAQGFKDFSFVLGNDTNNLNAYFKEIANIYTEDDPQEYYVGYLHNKPIVCGLICFFGRVAGLHCLTTSKYYRRLGYGTAMQKFRLKRAKDSGFHTAVLQASDSSYSLYSKLGWKLQGIFREFKKCR